METNQFILALSKTLPESCLQGLAVYLLLQLFFWVDKRSTPLLKFNLFYVANWCLFVGFLLTFFHHYQQIPFAYFKHDLFPGTIGNNIPIIITKPNLWLQFSFWTNHYAYLITGFYLLGLLFCMLKLTISIINISWFKSNKYLKLDDYLTQLSIQLSSNFRLIKTVSVYLSDKICVPLTLGFIKPIIVFPIALINQLSAEQTEAILLHELAHIKRKDYLLNILLCIVQSFLFFNPAIWLMQREINKYREQCCDDLVLDNTSHKLDYARALLLIEESRSTQLTLAFASNGKKYNLLNRIKRITNMKTNQPSPQNKLVVLLLALITIGLTVAWNVPAKKAVKYFANQSFKVIKKAPYSNHVEKFSNKTIEYLVHKSNKKTKPANRKFIVNSFIDTVIKSKNKFKIVLEDSVGNKKQYNSIEELPVEDQKEFLKENSKLNKLQKFDFKFKFPDSNKFVYNFTDEYHSNLKWKKQTELMRKQGEAMRKQFNSPEWKKQMENLRKQSAAIGEQARKQFDIPEFKAKIEKLREESKAMAEQANKQFNNPEFKQQIENLRLQGNLMNKQGEEMRKYYQSPEWKKQQKKINKEIEKSQKEWRKAIDFQPKPEIPNLPN